MKLLTLKADQIKKQIATKLQNVLAVDGFIYKKTVNEFKCHKGQFTYSFNLLQTSWSDHCSLNIRLGISEKQIENNLERIIGKQSNPLTFWTDLARIYFSPDGRQIVNGDLSILLFQNEDIEAAIETIGAFYINTVKQYFKKYDSLRAIDEIINNPPFEHCPAHLGGNFDERCMKGLIVAKLVGNPNYEQLVKIYDKAILTTMDTESIEKYHKVREYLMCNQI